MPLSEEDRLLYINVELTEEDSLPQVGRRNTLCLEALQMPLLQDI